MEKETIKLILKEMATVLKNIAAIGAAMTPEVKGEYYETVCSNIDKMKSLIEEL